MIRCNPDKAGAKAPDVMPFLRAWLADPIRVSAIAPSGPALADLITREITAKSAPVLELGPGTGVFTRALLARGLAQRDLTLIELGPDFVPLLQSRFPETRILPLDATRIAQFGIYEGSPVGAVVSGLPLLSMGPRKIMGILSSAFAYMRPGGAFYQFTYGPRCPVPRPILDRLGLKAVRIGRTILNVPPAAVYKITRRSARPGSRV